MESVMSSVINKSKFIVRVKRHPELNRTFPQNKAAKAEAYKKQLFGLSNVVMILGSAALILARTSPISAQTFRIRSASDCCLPALPITFLADAVEERKRGYQSGVVWGHA
jgi:hypothetical protein